jgi:hypothetical protein
VDKKGGGGGIKKSTLLHPGGVFGCPRRQKFEKKVCIEESLQIMIKNQVCVFLCAKSSVIGDKIDIKLHYIELLLFLSMWTGGGM